MLNRILLLLVLAASLFPRIGIAQSPTPASKVLNQWLATFNTGDSEKLLAFWKIYGTQDTATLVSRDQGLYGVTGGFTVIKILEDTGTHLVVSMKDGHGGFAEITIELASIDPPQIKSISGHPVDPPKPHRSPALNDEDLIKKVKEQVSLLSAKDEFSGAVLIAHNGHTIFQKASGLADRVKKIPNTLDTQFCLGSMNKMFTATAVLQLVHAGKLSLDGHISDYWPDYPNHDLASRVTVRQLLTHTGGTGDIFGPEMETHRTELRSIADYVKLYGQRPVAFEPGSRFEYSNYGYIILGHLIEIASGHDYSTYVQTHIYTPAGMKHTDQLPHPQPGRATGYMKSSNGLERNDDTLFLVGTSAGGGYSTVGDLLNFAKALQSGKLLDPALFQQATHDQAKHGYGFGFHAGRDGTFGHGGGAPGINGDLRILPTGYIVVVLENLDPPSATSMADFIDATVPSQPN